MDKSLDQQRSPTFCVAPWVQLATNASGNYRVCCHSQSGKNILLNERGESLKIFSHTVEEAWTSPTYRAIRGQFLKGEKPDMCVRCFREEAAGIKSARLKWNERWQSRFEMQIDPPADIKYIDLRLGNLCNLKCRMCNPYASSQWADDWNDVVDSAVLVPPSPLSEREQKRLKKLDWPTNESTWQALEPLIESIEEIYLTGGEPFLSLEQIKLLQKIIDLGCAKQITIKYNTNLTVLPEKLVNLWKEFKLVQLNVSVDGFGALDEYIRYPTRWAVVDENLHRLHILKEKQDNIIVGVHVTVQMYNILKLDELLRYLHSRFNLMPYLNILNHPECLNIRCLPLQLKQEAKERLADWSEHEEVSKIFKYMFKEDLHRTKFFEFQNYTQKLDKIRGQNLFELNSEFEEFF